MPRLSADQWESIRAEREAGASFQELADRHGLSKTAIVKRAKAEGWGDGTDVAETVRRKVTEKVTGIVTGGNHKKKAAAMDAAADEAAQVIRRHREEWEAHTAEFPLSAIARDFELGKSAKIAAEVLTIRQAGQRRAWGLDVAAPAQVPVSRPLVAL